VFCEEVLGGEFVEVLGRLDGEVGGEGEFGGGGEDDGGGGG